MSVSSARSALFHVTGFKFILSNTPSRPSHLPAATPHPSPAHLFLHPPRHGGGGGLIRNSGRRPFTSAAARLTVVVRRLAAAASNVAAAAAPPSVSGSFGR